jgi:hypothetical protein
MHNAECDPPKEIDFSFPNSNWPVFFPCASVGDEGEDVCPGKLKK